MVAVLLQAASLALNLLAGLACVLGNKAAFVTAKFTYPTALTALHYATNYAALLALAGVFAVRAVRPEDTRALRLTTAVWAAHNAISNASLARNSVGVYQIAKILVTPLIVVLEFAAYGRVPPRPQALALLGACAGVALATVGDVQLDAHGLSTALVSAGASALLKVLQEHMLQRRGLTSLELMRHTWGPQLLLLLLATPLLDAGAPELLSGGYVLTRRRALLLLGSCAAAFALNVSALFALKLTSAISLVMLSQAKTASILLGGYVFFDGTPNAQTLGGAALAIASISAYTHHGLARAERERERAAAGLERCDAGADGGGADDEHEVEEQPLRRSACS